jgi:hypothetical protein
MAVFLASPSPNVIKHTHWSLSNVKKPLSLIDTLPLERAERVAETKYHSPSLSSLPLIWCCMQRFASMTILHRPTVYKQSGASYCISSRLFLIKNKPLHTPRDDIHDGKFFCSVQNILVICVWKSENTTQLRVIFKEHRPGWSPLGHHKTEIRSTDFTETFASLKSRKVCSNLYLL